MRFLPDFENWRRWRNGCWWRGGGWFTPLSATLSFADWVRDEQLPVILVVGIKLGCINHALLTAQAVRQAGLPLVGWIANDIQPPGKRHAEYLATLTIDLRLRCWVRSHGWRTRRGVRISASTGSQRAGSGVIHCASSGSSSWITRPCATLRPRCSRQNGPLPGE